MFGFAISDGVYFWLYLNPNILLIIIFLNRQ